MAKVSRSSRAGAVALAVVVAALGGAATPAGAARDWTRAVHSMPGFRIPKVIVTARDPNVAPGYIFASPRTIYPGRTGPVILDADGHVVWFHRESAHVTGQGLRPQMLDGKPVLTWSIAPPLRKEGDIVTRGSTPHNNYNVIADQSYHIIKRVRAKGRGVITDGHEFVITSQNTALLLAGRFLNKTVHMFGTTRRGFVDDLVQEIDLHTGQVIFSWSAARHIPLDETVVRPTEGNWDPYHLNSISVDSDGNLLVSARHTSTVYKVDRHSGSIIWRLGGKRSDFRLSSAATFYYQHDAERQSDGTITLFDNHSTDTDHNGGNSFGKRLRLNMSKKTASLVRAFPHPSGQGLATSQGNVDVLPNGNTFIGWGINPWFGEYAPDGRLLFGARFWSVWHHSYRAYKRPWVGQPTTKPALQASVKSGKLIAFVSWNGATEVRQWQFLTGDDPGSLTPAGAVPWADFETKATLSVAPKVVQVQALDADGNVIGTSLPMTPAGA